MAAVAWSGSQVFKSSAHDLLEVAPIEQKEQEDLFVFVKDTGMTRVSDDEFDRTIKAFKSGDHATVEASLKKLES